MASAANTPDFLGTDLSAVDFTQPMGTTGLSAGDPSVTDVNYSTFDPFAGGNISLNGAFPSPSAGAMPSADGSNLPTAASSNPNPTGDWLTAVTNLASSATRSMTAFVPSGPSPGIPVARQPVGSNYFSAAANRMPSFSANTIVIVLVVGLGLWYIMTHAD